LELTSRRGNFGKVLDKHNGWKTFLLAVGFDVLWSAGKDVRATANGDGKNNLEKSEDSY